MVKPTIQFEKREYNGKHTSYRASRIREIPSRILKQRNVVNKMDLMMLPEFVKLALFMAAVFISNIIQALTGFAGVMLSIPPTILLYGPDMAKAVINVICWLVCVLLMVQNRKYINPKELFRIARRHGYWHSPLQRREPGHPRSSLRRHHRSRCTEEPLHEAV